MHALDSVGPTTDQLCYMHAHETVPGSIVYNYWTGVVEWNGGIANEVKRSHSHWLRALLN